MTVLAGVHQNRHRNFVSAAQDEAFSDQVWETKAGTYDRVSILEQVRTPLQGEWPRLDKQV